MAKSCLNTLHNLLTHALGVRILQLIFKKNPKLPESLPWAAFSTDKKSHALDIFMREDFVVPYKSLLVTVLCRNKFVLEWVNKNKQPLINKKENNNEHRFFALTPLPKGDFESEKLLSSCCVILD